MKIESRLLLGEVRLLLLIPYRVRNRLMVIHPFHAEEFTSSNTVDPDAFFTDEALDQSLIRFEAPDIDDAGLSGVEDVTLETDAGLSWREERMSEEAKERRHQHQQALAERYRQEQGMGTTEPASLAED
jgi:hypothetical protein